jgi:hypothetical protein
MNQMYVSKWIYLVAISIVLIGGLNWGIIGVFGKNLIGAIGWPLFERIIYILVGIATIYLLFDRNTYLPFLGDTVFPCPQLADKMPTDATVSVTVQVPPGAKVVYWAAEHSEDMAVAPNPWVAYLNYENTGVVTADPQGHAVLKVREPQQYKIPHQLKTINKHIHYRFCQTPGMLSAVHTVFL